SCNQLKSALFINYCTKEIGPFKEDCNTYFQIIEDYFAITPLAKANSILHFNQLRRFFDLIPRENYLPPLQESTIHFISQFFRKCNADNITNLPIPKSLQDKIKAHL